MANGINVQIGAQSWAREIRDFTDNFDPLFWSGFAPWAESQIVECEAKINRKFPDEFRLYLLEFGSGRFQEAYGGGIDSSEDIAVSTAGPFWMILGCSTCAIAEEHRRMYQTRGKFNPLVDYIQESDLIQDGISLFDLLQIGSDGCCNYHLINVSEESIKRPFGYCLLTPDPTFENKAPSFSAGLSLILSYHEACARGEGDIVNCCG